ncbi:MAG: DEAD/DEAH box helicase family protein [Lachnospiraceae bacterium]|nr:DEAD/DEAH box helicase family protein [Lachnospiraceae bacterium]
MSRFKGIRFKGEFRNYQQRVLNNVDKYLEDGKIHIVAAPGSGKTVLGLELIRRLGEPCLILSPTTAIRDQWSQRFREMFLHDESRFEELFSTDLHHPKLINSITYQALYMAMERISEVAEGEVDCSDIDLFRVLRKQGIKTICLDEAHHLKNEWQKALERFLNRLEGGMTRICLTATPPYDADINEWTRYYNICGDIDEEIFVPEMVAQGNLCPHQDYVYFNYPSPQEEKAFLEHKAHVQAVLQEVGELECIEEVAEVIGRWDHRMNYALDMLKNHREELEALLVLLKYYGYLTDKKQVRRVMGRKELPAPSEAYFEKAIQFILNEKDEFHIADEEVEKLIRVLRKHQVYQKKRVRLTLTETLRKDLISSVGKLKSIADITTHEYHTLGKDLRMLILADYNRGTKENLSKIGTEESFHDVSVVSIFETLRRLDETMKIAVLSGSLIFLPEDLVPEGTMLMTEPLGDTGYVSVEMMGSNRDRIQLVGSLFREGKLQVLIGTKALLGEGWDEPSINALILASFVGTFVSSNQMRGRAIRVNPADPDKTANIWHLVTLEPKEVVKETALERLAAAIDGERESLQGCDYDVVKQRFETFMAPHYETGEIQSGIDRLTLIRPPFDANGILRINREMLEKSEDRKAMSSMWRNQLVENSCQVVVQTKLPLENRLPTSGYLIKYWSIVYGIAILILIFWPKLSLGFFTSAFFEGRGILGKTILGLFGSILWYPWIAALILLVSVLWLPRTIRAIKSLFYNRTPLTALESVSQNLVKTLKECKLIAPGASVEVVKSKDSDKAANIQLQNASMHDQNVFNTAIRELLAPIDKPRYLLTPKAGSVKKPYLHALACPSIIGKRKEYVAILEKHLGKSLVGLEAVYTGSERGRKSLHRFMEARFTDKKKELPLLEGETKYVVVKNAPQLLLEDKGEPKTKQ